MIKKSILLLITIIFVSSLPACKEDKKLRIGVSQCSDDDWRHKMNDEIMREIMLHPDVEVEIRSADDSNEKQIADLRYFAENGFDIVLVAPIEADAITPVVKEIYESGVPVVVFDRTINGDSYTAKQEADNVGIGRSAAQYAHSLVGDGANIIEISGRKGSTPALGRHEGFHALCDSLGMNVIASVHGVWNHDDAVRVADSLLKKYTDVDLIYAHNDRMAIGASEVARRHGRDIRVIGIDAAPEIGIRAVADGLIDATFLYPTEGYRLIRTALAILRGKPYERNVVLPVSSAVDTTNADILLLQNESIKEETAKIQKLKGQVDNYFDRHSAQTTLFYAMMVILALLLVVLFMILRTFWSHRRHQRALLEQNRLLEQQRDTEKSLNARLEAATQSKLIFFTNVSHDLSTPLTLIAEPVGQLAAADYLTPRHHALMQIADKNVRILRRLINQILDFRKYENGKLRTVLGEVCVGELVKEWSEGFFSVARKRSMSLIVNVETPADFTSAVDVDKIERVFFNLLSNAFKYTPDNGRIAVRCALDGESLIISVEDNGQGISADDLGNIFDRFYQVDKVHPKGSGIGLSLAKAFVELHGGRIEVDSAPGKGSRFAVYLPIRHVEKNWDVHSSITGRDIEAELGNVEVPVLHADVDSRQIIEPDAPDESCHGAELPSLLVIDDNDDIRAMIRQLLGEDYNILEASNGREGIRSASKYVPDLIICDVMMPVMDGLECCRRIKDEISTSHIPVLMLTACSMDEQRIQGYESGADGYLAKPFNSEMLQKRCENLIANRRRIHDLFNVATRPSTSLSTGPDAITDTPRTASTFRTTIDDEFYARFADIVEAEMADADLNIDTIASKLGLGRSQFYRKIKALTNYSPVEFLRKLRLERARHLLTTTDRSVSEIAYQVGFSAPAYFTRVYRETYGETPTEMRTRLGR